MKLSLSFQNLKFKFEAGTSRGVLNDKKSWIVKIQDGDKIGYGEIAPLKGLSIEGYENFESKLITQLKQFVSKDFSIGQVNLSSSTKFGLETALKAVNCSSAFKISENSFITNQESIRINGLVWMGAKEFMLKQIDDKISQGFTCIKMKIGAINFDEELSILKSIRKKYNSSDLTLRVDANGAFEFDEAQNVLSILSSLDIHSIEQPIKQGQINLMNQLCQMGYSCGVALDEELIGVENLEDKQCLLTTIKPQYIILKPTLHGGISGTKEWIKLAEDQNIKWWITSALESNIGLNAVCQIASEYNPETYQGLGTGSLYNNNIPSPLTLDGEHIFYDQKKEWDLSHLDFVEINP